MVLERRIMNIEQLIEAIKERDNRLEERLERRDTRIFEKLDEHTKAINSALISIEQRPCKAHEEKMNGMNSRIKQLWVVVGILISAIVGAAWKISR